MRLGVAKRQDRGFGDGIFNEDHVVVGTAVFQCASPFVAGTEQISIDGTPMREGIDYESLPDAGQIVFKVPPLQGSEITFQYEEVLNAHA